VNINIVSVASGGGIWKSSVVQASTNNLASPYTTPSGNTNTGTLADSGAQSFVIADTASITELESFIRTTLNQEAEDTKPPPTA
jgi:hypothetical protein